MADGASDGVMTVKDRHAALHETLRQRICLLDYPPATHLSEIALAKEFGTSRTPVRRVLARLEEEGLVQSVHGVGTIVTDADITELEQAYRLRVELTALTGTLDPVMPGDVFFKRLQALIDRAFEMSGKPLPDLSDIRLPNPVDLGRFTRTCFLHDGVAAFDEAG